MSEGTKHAMMERRKRDEAAALLERAEVALELCASVLSGQDASPMALHARMIADEVVLDIQAFRVGVARG